MPTYSLDEQKKNCVAVVLVGGMGTRIRHLLPDLPKPLAPVFGRPFLEWVLRFISKQRLTNVVLSTGYLAEKIEFFVKNADFKCLDLQCVEEALPLGTAGGVLNAIDSCKYEFETVLVLNGDSLVLTDLAPMFGCLKEGLVDVAMLGVKVADAARYGTLDVSGDNFLLGFKEKQPGMGLINAGVYLFRGQILDVLPRGEAISFEIDIFPKLLANGVGIKVIEVEASFIDIGTEKSLLGANEFIKTHINFFNSTLE